MAAPLAKFLRYGQRKEIPVLDGTEGEAVKDLFQDISVQPILALPCLYLPYVIDKEVRDREVEADLFQV